MPKPLVDRLEGLAPVGGHRAAEPDRLQPLHRRHGHRGLRLPPAPLGPGRPELLPASAAAPVRRDTPQIGGRRRPRRRPAARVQVAFPLPPVARLTHAAVVENLRALGFVRVRRRRRAAPPGRAARAASTSPGPASCWSWWTGSAADAGGARADRRGGRHRLPGGRRRRAGAARRSDGSGSPARPPAAAATRPPPTVTPALFSFNNPRGACADCNGFGAVLEYDESLIVPDPGRSLAEGAIDPWTKPRYETPPQDPARVRPQPRRRSRPSRGTSSRRPTAASCSTAARAATSASSPSSRAWRRSGTSSTSGSSSGSTSWRKTCADVRRHPAQPRRAGGADRRATPSPRWRRARWTASAAGSTRSRSRRSSARSPQLILEQLDARLGFLRDVGLGLSHARPADPHAVRRRGAADLARQRARRAAGGHALRAGRAVDRPAPARHRPPAGPAPPAARRAATPWSSSSTTSRPSGRPTSCSSSAPARASAAAAWCTRGRSPGRGAVAHRPVPHRAEADRRARALRRPAGPLWLRVRGRRRCTTCAGVDADIPLGTLTAVTGRLGLGQEHAAPRRDLPATSRRGSAASTRPSRTWAKPVGQVASLTGWELLKDVLLVDQSPIGRSPALQSDHLHQGVRRDPRAVRRAAAGARSASTPPRPSPSTCRAAAARSARAPGTCRSRWSSWPTSSCPARRAAARRYRRDVLDVRIHGHSIHDVLQWTVDEAIARFRHQPKLGTRALAAPAGRARLPAAGPAGDDAVRRRGAAAQDRPRADPGRQARGPEALHPRRADHRPAPRRRAGADPGARPPGRRRAHRGRHRASPRRDQAGRLDHRPRARRPETPAAAWSLRERRRRSPSVESSHTGRYLRPLLPSAHALAG